MSEKRTPDDGRNERQRQQQEQDARPERLPAGSSTFSPRPERERVPDDGRNERQRLLEDKPFDFIERTKPEDRLSEHGGQLTRDNVNPAIPSAPPGTGGIVDPNSLGMTSTAGVAPPAMPTQQHTDEQDTALRNHLPSINEPPGSNITTGDAGPVELPPLVLSDIDPDAMVVGSGTFPLTVTGSGFTPESVVVFDDADVPTTFVSQTELTADCPVAAAADIVDVEVHRGEDMSDVLTFEFTAVMREGREKKPPERKPKKDTPTHKRANKRK